MGAPVASGSPASAEATVPAVIGEYDKFNRGFDYADAKRRELAELAGVSPFDAETMRDAANIVAGRIRGGLQVQDDDTKVKDPVTGKLVSTKPGWYKPGSTGPTDPNMPLNAIGVGLGALSQGKQAQANALARDPNRTAGNKMLDQSRATSAGVLGALASYFGNADAKNEDRRLDHAAKEAQMYRTLNPSRGGTGDPQYDAAIAALRADRDAKNLGLAAERAGQNQERIGANVALEVDKATPSSPLAKRNAQIAVELGLVNPEAAAKFSDNDWKRWASGLEQKDQQRFTVAIKKFERDLENRKLEEKLVADQELQIVQDRNKRAYELADAAIAGGQWSVKPTDRTRSDVLGMIDARQVLMDGAREIAAARAELEKRHGTLERGIEFLNRKDINLFPEDANLLRRITGNKMAMDAAYSKVFNYGVPSGPEFRRTGQLSGATGLNSLLFPQEFYKAVEDEAREHIGKSINNRGFWFEGQQAPAMQQVQEERIGISHEPTQASPELEQITNPPSAPRPASTPPAQAPVPAPIQSSSVSRTVGGQPAATPSETETNRRGQVMPTEGALRAQNAEGGGDTLPAAAAPAPLPITKGEPKKPPTAAPAGAPKAAPDKVFSVTINGKPGKATQAEIDALKEGAKKKGVTLKIEVQP